MNRHCTIEGASIELADGRGDGEYGLHDACGSPAHVATAICRAMAGSGIGSHRDRIAPDDGRPAILNVYVIIRHAAPDDPAPSHISPSYGRMPPRWCAIERAGIGTEHAPSQDGLDSLCWESGSPDAVADAIGRALDSADLATGQGRLLLADDEQTLLVSLRIRLELDRECLSAEALAQLGE